MQGAQKLRSEAHLRVRRNDEVAAQRRRWTFYETGNIQKSNVHTQEFGNWNLGDYLGFGIWYLTFYSIYSSAFSALSAVNLN